MALDWDSFYDPLASAYLGSSQVFDSQGNREIHCHRRHHHHHHHDGCQTPSSLNTNTNSADAEQKGGDPHLTEDGRLHPSGQVDPAEPRPQSTATARIAKDVARHQSLSRKFVPPDFSGKESYHSRATEPLETHMLPEVGSGNQKDQRCHAHDAASFNDVGPSAVQQDFSDGKPTHHFPIGPQSPHLHPSTDSRHSTILFGNTATTDTLSTDSMESAPAPSIPECSRCGLPRVCGVLHPDLHTCHTPLVIGNPSHELTSHLGPESLGHSSRLGIEDGR